MGDYKLVSITKSSKSNKKLMAKFKDKKSGRESQTHFGATGYKDWTIGATEQQRKNYRSRHRGDNLTNPRSPGSLSWHILWGQSKSKRENIASFKRKFRL